MDTDKPHADNPKEAPNPSPNIENKHDGGETKTKKVDFKLASQVEKTEKKKG